MSLSNLVPFGGSEGSEFRSRVAGRDTELIEEPGFLRELLDEPPAGLDSFGSEENCPDLDPVLPSSRNLSPSARSRSTGQPRPDSGLAEVSSPATPREDRIPPPEHPPAADLDAHVSRTALLSRIVEWFEHRTSSVSSGALLAPLRWSRAHFNLRIAITIALTLTGVAEASWLGVRAARRMTALSPDDAEWPSATAGDSTSRQTMAGSGSEVLVSVHSSPPATRPSSPKVPGWVSISTPSPVEILEHGRVIGASWNGGVRLAPGRHDVRLLNRAEAIDLEQSLDIAPDSMTSVVVEYLPPTLQTAACPAGQCGSKPGLSAQSR
jgi:hypothetical protein